MRLKKTMSVLLSTVMVAGVATACTNKEDGKGGTASAGGKDQKVEITWWEYPNFDALDGEVGKYEKQLIAAFNQKNPDIKVNLEMISYEAGPEKINVALASNSAPDVIYDSPGRILDYGKKGYLAKLNDMVDDTFKKEVSDAVWKQSKVGDNIYMYPINTTPFMMAFNKTLFEKIGALDLLPLNKPERRWTLDEYEKALQAVKDKAPGVFPSAFFAKNTGGDQATRAYLSNLYGANFINDSMDKVTINDDAGVKALQWVVDGVKNKLVAPGSESMTSNDNLDLFMQGKLASTIIYSSVLKKIYSTKKVSPFDEVFLPWPTAPGKDPGFEPFIGGMAIFDNKDPKKIEASKKLVDFIANDKDWRNKNIVSTGGFSVRSSVSNLYDDPEMKYVESMRKYIIDSASRADGFAEVRTAWFPELQKAMVGQATPKQALDTFATKANEIIKKSKK